MSQDPSDFLKPSYTNIRVSADEMYAQDFPNTIFMNYGMPFDYRKSLLSNNEESADTKSTATGSNLESPVNNDEKMDKLLKDLDFID